MTEPTSESLPPDVVTDLYNRHARDLAAFLLGLLGTHEDADEALQSTFLKTIQQGHNVNLAAFRAWLFRVAFNEAMLLKRRAKTRKRSLSNLSNLLKPNESDVAQLVSDADLQDRAVAALDQLPEAQRQVVRMRIYDDMTFAAIADHLAVPLGTVLSRMRLAMKKLLGILPKQE